MINEFNYNDLLNNYTIMDLINIENSTECVLFDSIFADLLDRRL